jgi:serine O-acetyltransferase
MLMERLHYAGHALHKARVPLLPRLCMLLIRVLYGSYVPYQVSIGPGVSFGHRIGIVIAPKSVIGARCKIRHRCTLANTDAGSPILEDDVQIGCGAALIGPVRIGRGAKIGANAVVTRDVLPGRTAVGAPAHMVDKRPWLAITKPPADVSYIDARN